MLSWNQRGLGGRLDFSSVTPTYCVTLNELPNLFGFTFPTCKMGIIIEPSSQGGVED